MLSQLKLFLLPCLLMSSPTLEVLDYEMLSQNISSILSDPLFNNTDVDDYEYKLFENYFPLLLMLISLPQNETESLEKYMKQRTYAELKRMIDEKQKEMYFEQLKVNECPCDLLSKTIFNAQMLSAPQATELAATICSESDITELVSELEANNTDLSEFISVVDNQKYASLIEAYHNASIYNAIRGVWSSQLNPLLPPIDQLAILEYFAERRLNEHFRMSFWAKLWAAIRAWITGKQELIECNADEPRCMRRIIEKLPLEARVELDRAAETEDVATVENIITEELINQPQSARVEYELWKSANVPPQPLLDIIADKTDTEERALERLRTYDLLNSIKDYYRAMIESRSQADQEEIRRFFQRMNDTFARCFNPIKDRYEYRY